MKFTKEGSVRRKSTFEKRDIASGPADLDERHENKKEKSAFDSLLAIVDVGST